MSTVGKCLRINRCEILSHKKKAPFYSSAQKLTTLPKQTFNFYTLDTLLKSYSFHFEREWEIISLCEYSEVTTPKLLYFCGIFVDISSFIGDQDKNLGFATLPDEQLKLLENRKTEKVRCQPAQG
jgi:hypothetical protein